MEITDTVKFNYLYYPTPPTAEVRDTKCRDIRRELYIYWNGKAPLCGYQYLSRTGESLGDIREMTIARESADVIRNKAVAEGMKLLRDDGLEKVKLGITSIAEVARVAS